MYPVIRLAKQIILNRKAGRIALDQTHLAHLRAWPWDIDVFLDLNNGRILTLMDLGRIGLFTRNGVIGALKEKGWYGTVAGLLSGIGGGSLCFSGWSLGPVYWAGTRALLISSTAFGTKINVVPMRWFARRSRMERGSFQRIKWPKLWGFDTQSPPLPDWVMAWAGAEEQRPWPPS